MADGRLADGSMRTILITGGAGFVGANLAARLLGCPGATVRILDNSSRAGVEHNLDWLRAQASADRLEIVPGDVRDAATVSAAAAGCTEIYHLAAQVAVTTSIEAPAEDFYVNALGTLHVLETARRSPLNPFVLFTSTNKVYGSLDGVPARVQATRYVADDPLFRGVGEAEPLDFHSPYGCSKGAADQYVRDYGRIYGLQTVVLRMSCIAGPRQFGTEDQGWVAHFLYSALEGRPLTIYGDGFQVRDVLHVDDLLDAIEAAFTHRRRSAGQIYNVGGGLERAVSITEMLEAIAQETGSPVILRHAPTRPGDQPLYISDTAKLTAHTGWAAGRSVAEILGALHRFWREHRELLVEQRGAVAAETELVGGQVIR